MSFSFITQQLAQQRENNLYRQRQVVSEQAGREIVIAGKKYLNFSSNDYLGLANHPLINKALAEGADKFGASSCSSNLVTGYHYAHQALEDTVCQWLNKPRCLLFNSGFSANTAVLQALGNNESQFFLDKLSHASLIDGALASKAKVKRFLHNDHQQLEQLLSKKSQKNNLIVSEGIFSMDGDRADVALLGAIAKQHQAWLYIDDAHSIGVIGDKGQGSNSSADVDITMATFGKALATSGAFVTCSEQLYEYLINFSRHYIYSTAMSPAIAWATKKSIEIAQNEHWRREKIVALSELLSSSLKPSIELVPTDSSIHAIILGDEKHALNVAEQLKQQGIWLTAIRPPTVPTNTSRLRVTICAHHNSHDIKSLADNINKVVH